MTKPKPQGSTIRFLAIAGATYAVLLGIALLVAQFDWIHVSSVHRFFVPASLIFIGVAAFLLWRTRYAKKKPTRRPSR